MQPDDFEARAREATGLCDFGDPSYREGLAALCESAAGEARLNPIGRMLFESYVTGALANRLRVHEYLRLHPECLAVPIAAPAFVFGWDFGAQVEARMRRYLHENPQGRHGRHSYSLERFGVSEAEVRELLGFYEDRYAIPLE